MNLRNWESRVAIHAASNTYDLAGLAADPNAFSRVAAFDIAALGDLRGVDAVHLQCHIGTDTVSLARAGARMTGVDFSPQALSVARDLAQACGLDVRFQESVLYAVPDVLGRDFDLVYTGVGALCWLPDIAGWARVVAGLLRPGGRPYLRDAHPILNAIDDTSGDDVLRVTLPYFEGVPQRWVADVTYTDGPRLESPETYEWNHGLGEVVQAVLGRRAHRHGAPGAPGVRVAGPPPDGAGCGRPVPPARRPGPAPADVHARGPARLAAPGPRR